MKYLAKVLLEVEKKVGSTDNLSLRETRDVFRLARGQVPRTGLFKEAARSVGADDSRERLEEIRRERTS